MKFIYILGKVELNYLISQFKLNSGRILRGDHTYKISKSLGAVSSVDGKWVFI